MITFSLLPSLQVMSPLSPRFHSPSIQILRDGVGRAVHRREETYLAVVLPTSPLLPCRTFRRLLLRPCLAHSIMLFSTSTFGVKARARLDPRFKHFNLVRFWIPRHPEFARSFVLTKAREITSLLSYHTHFWDPISSWIAASPYGATHSTEWYHAIVVLHYALELWIGATSTTMKTEMLETKLQILPSLWQHRGS